MKPTTSRSEDSQERLRLSATEPLWTVDDVAKYLRIQQETVRVMARSKQIPAFKVGKAWRFKASDIKGIINSERTRQGGSEDIQ